MKYLAILERAGSNFSTYVPDFPGCVATGKTPEAAQRKLTKVLAMHVAGLREDGLAVPHPNATADSVELA